MEVSKDHCKADNTKAKYLLSQLLLKLVIRERMTIIDRNIENIRLNRFYAMFRHGRASTDIGCSSASSIGDHTQGASS